MSAMTPILFSVEMSQNAIDKAKHINELEKDLYSNTLNIDLVQAGVAEQIAGV